MLHNPYLQTAAKVLECGIIDDMFMKVDNGTIKDRILSCENGVYTIDLTDSVEMFVCLADQFSPIDEGYLFNIYCFSEKQWISVIFGDIAIHHYIPIVDGGEKYLQSVSDKIDTVRFSSPVDLYHTGVDVLAMNESIILEPDKRIGIAPVDVAQDLLFVRYHHNAKESKFTQYYQEKPYRHKGYINSRAKIIELKKAIRMIINNAEAISRNQSRLSNLF